MTFELLAGLLVIAILTVVSLLLIFKRLAVKPPAAPPIKDIKQETSAAARSLPPALSYFLGGDPGTGGCLDRFVLLVRSRAPTCCEALR